MAGNSIKTTALYCRLSNADGDDAESNSISTQKAILTRYAKKQGFYKTKFFVDDGYTGTNFDRPGFKKMLKGIEAGDIGTVIVKDRSRLGRNFLETGKYTQIVFPEHGVKFIAVSNPTEGDPDDAYDFDVFLDIFNSWYPKDVSRTVKAVLRSKSKSGHSISSVPSYGYMRNPDDKDTWLVDPETSVVVKRIFKLCMEGHSAARIATMMKKDKVLSPSAYKCEKTGGCAGTVSHDPYGWTRRTVRRILENPAYTGTVINFRSKRVSFNSKKRVPTEDSEQIIIPNAHPALISEAEFKTVQRLCSLKLSINPLDEDACPLTGLTYCADCGRILYHSRTRNRRGSDCFRCSGAQMGYGCTTHSIRADDLTDIVEKKVKAMVQYCIENEDEFLERVSMESKENADRKKEMEVAEDRLNQIERIFANLYEDKSSGIITDEQFLMLAGRYTKEQAEIKKKVEILKKTVTSSDDRKKGAGTFLAEAKKYQGFESLNTEIARMLISKVLVKEKEHPGSHENDARPERIEIEWNFIGKFEP